MATASRLGFGDLTGTGAQDTAIAALARDRAARGGKTTTITI